MVLIAYTYLVIVDVACIASGTYLVVTDHPGWAWIPFLLACSTTIGSRRDSKP